MRRTLLAALVSAACLIAIPCSAQAPARLTDARRAAIADSLRGIARVFADGINALDIERQLRYFSPDADMTWAADGQLVVLPHDSLGALYRGIYRGFRHMQFAWDTMRVTVLGPDAGVVTAAGHYAVTDTAGQTTRHRVVSTYVFARRRDGWQLVHGHASHTPAQP